MTGLVDLSPMHLATVEGILAEHVPDCEVRAFGSRAKWSARDASDLDLAIVGDGPLPSRTLTMLKEAFEESRLPMRVDVIDWNAIADSFRELIGPDTVVVQEALLPPGWRQATFGECAVLVRDTVSPTNMGDVPYIGLEHIGEGTLSLVGLGVATEVTSAKSRFKNNDVLFGKLRPYFRKVVRACFDGICSTDIWVIRPAEGVDAGYLFYVMASQEFVDVATRGSEGTRMPRAKWDFVSRICLSLPPLEEQQAIARVLGALDDKIELNRRMGETLEEMARALFKSWFVDFDPVRAKAKGQPSGLPPALDALFPESFKASELGQIPVGWEVCSLDEIATFTNGLALQRFPSEGDEWLPVVKIAEMRRGYTERTGRASVNIDPRYIVEDGDVLFSWSGSLELVLWTHGRGALNQHLFKVTSDEFPRWFYLGWTREHLDDFREIAASKATTMGHIQRRHLTDAKVVVPSHEVINAGHEALAPLVVQQLDRAIEARTLVTQRDALLPRLVSGALRAVHMDVSDCGHGLTG